MSNTSSLVLLRESLSGIVRRFEQAHGAALLAYPGTLWAEVKEEIHEAAQAVVDWNTPSPEVAPAADKVEFTAPADVDVSQKGIFALKDKTLN